MEFPDVPYRLELVTAAVDLPTIDGRYRNQGSA